MIVGQLDRLRFIADAENRSDRAENLILIRRRAFWNIGKNCWLVKESRSMNAIATGQAFCSGGDGLLDLLVHAIQDLFSGERADLCFVSERVADFESAYPLDELAQEIVVDLIGDKKPLGGDTRLAGINRARRDSVG